MIPPLPEKYQPEQVAAAIAEAIAAERSKAPEATPSPAADFGFPGFDQVRRLGLQFQTGTYATVTDPRIARATAVTGSGRAGRWQRFRIERGITLVPFAKPPIAFRASGAPTNFDRRTWFGRLLVGIPHGLGRMPEGVFFRASSDERGPASQRLEISGGTASTLPTGYANGEPVRAQLDILPIFGRTPDQVRRELWFLTQEWDGSASTGLFNLALAGGGTGTRVFEAANLPNAIVAELATTTTRFSAFLLATSWGIPTFQASHGYYSGAPANTLLMESVATQVGDTVQGHNETMSHAALPGIGKAPYAMRVNRWVADPTLQQIHDDGLRLTLAEGSVDFVVG